MQMYVNDEKYRMYKRCKWLILLFDPRKKKGIFPLCCISRQFLSSEVVFFLCVDTGVNIFHLVSSVILYFSYIERLSVYIYIHTHTYIYIYNFYWRRVVFIVLCQFLLHSKLSHLYIDLTLFETLFPYTSLQSIEQNSLLTMIKFLHQLSILYIEYIFSVIKIYFFSVLCPLPIFFRLLLLYLFIGFSQARKSFFLQWELQIVFQFIFLVFLYCVFFKSKTVVISSFLP